MNNDHKQASNEKHNILESKRREQVVSALTLKDVTKNNQIEQVEREPIMMVQRHDHVIRGPPESLCIPTERHEHA